jgi:ankyrin repeat protein
VRLEDRRLRGRASLAAVCLGVCLALTGGVSAQLVIDDTPPLIAAVRAADTDAVRGLLADGADAITPQADGTTALHWAVHRESVELVDLLGAGADPDRANDLGTTPLVMASAQARGSIVARLLEASANPNLALASGETPLMHAARGGSVAAIEALLEHGADVDATESARRQTALMWAVANRHPEITRRLVDAGADVTARTDTWRRVYNMGGSRSAGSASGSIALQEVVEGGSTPLLFAARSGDVDSARILVAAGADVEDVAGDGNTALVIATHSGHATLAAYLLEAGADPNRSPLGYTALHAAVLRGTLRDRLTRNDDVAAGRKIVRALLQRGADPDARLERGTPVRRWSHDFAFMDRWVGATPYWLAAKFLETELMETLAEAGTDTRLASEDGTTPLMAAAGQGYNRGGGSAFIKDRRDFSSYNPVASAALGSRIPPAEEAAARETVALALALGGDVLAANRNGDTALHAAAAQGMDTVIELLTRAGADVTAENARGQRPLALAVYSDGIAGDRYERETTTALLRSLEGSDAPTNHPSTSHRHPEAQTLAMPEPVTETSIAAGARTYERFCATCHGVSGLGDGRLAAATAAYGSRPSNLTDAVWQHGESAGEVFVAIRDGIGPDFSMDAFGQRLTETEIWEIVGFLRSLR